jgi:hypothetical protein
MKRLLRLAVLLYPSWWRQRYATEFEALLDDVMLQRARASARAVDDVTPGWRELFDILHGALTMQLRSFGTIPVVCTLAGALVGGLLAMRIPTLYASSATIRVDAPEVTNVQSPRAEEFRVSLEKALGEAGAAPRATTVTLHRDSAGTTIWLTYSDRDPMQAQRGAERLAAAVRSGTSERGDSAEVIAAPALPTSPVRPDYPQTVGAGAAVGLMAGGVIFLLVSSRRRQASSRLP